MTEYYNFIISLVAVVSMLVGVGGIVMNRIKTGKGIGLRVIQFSVVIMTVPTILILGIEGKLEPATLGTLIGALIGYVLSSMGKDEK